MTRDIWLIVLTIILVAVGAVLIAAETAIARISRARVDELRRDGRRGADRLLAMLDDRPRYVNVLLFLSTIASVTATVIVGYLAVDLLAGDLGWSLGWSLLAAVLVMVVVSYIVLGVAPRTIGRQHAEQVALTAAGPSRVLAVLLGPVTTLLIGIGNALTPGRGFREGPFATQAELREVIDLAEADDLIEDEERQMIHSVFELGDTFVKEVMVPRTEVLFIESTRSLRQALSLGLRSGFSRIPVIGENEDDIVGIVYLKDVVKRVFEHREAEHEERVASILRQATFVPDSKPVDMLLREMQAARVHMAIVVDEYGGTAGLVTIEDILEEIVGEIADEYDTAAPEVTELADGSVRVSARLHVEEFGDIVGIEIDAEDEGVDTILGWMAKQLGRVPLPGASVSVEGWVVTAERGAGRRGRIGSVLLERTAVDDEPMDVQ